MAGVVCCDFGVVCYRSVSEGADRFCDDTIDHEFRESPPGKRSEILLVVEFDVFAAQQHQLAGERFVFDGKFEFVGLDRTGRFGPYAGLDQLAFVGFEDEPFIDDIVQLSAFDALAEDEDLVEFEPRGHARVFHDAEMVLSGLILGNY